MLRKAQQLGEAQVYCWRDDHPRSRKLLETVGFQLMGLEDVTLFDGSIAQKEVWLWQIPSPSEPSPSSAP
jgi:hypothetical protein